MQVCFITGEFPPMQGGVGDYTAYLARSLRDLGVEVSVITTIRAQRGGKMAGFRVLPVVKSWGFGCWRTIGSHLGELQPEIVHIQYQTAAYGMHPAINLLPLYLRWRRNRPKVVATFHDVRIPYLFPKAGPLRRAPAALLARFSDAVIATNQQDALLLAHDRAVEGEHLLTRHGGRRLYCIPIGSNIPLQPPPSYHREEWRRRLGIKAGELLLAYFGFLNENKGLDTLLAALKELLGRGCRARLLMVGGTAGDSDPTNRQYERRFRTAVDELELRGHVLWTGYTKAEEVSASLLAADIGVLPFHDGASLRHGTLVAAIVHGLPIVTTQWPDNVGDAAMAALIARQCGSLKAGENVVAVSPKDPKALAAAIEELAASSELRSRLSRGATALASCFDWGRIAAMTLKVYEETLRS